MNGHIGHPRAHHRILDDAECLGMIRLLQASSSRRCWDFHEEKIASMTLTVTTRSRMTPKARRRVHLRNEVHVPLYKICLQR